MTATLVALAVLWAAWTLHDLVAVRRLPGLPALLLEAQMAADAHFFCGSTRNPAAFSGSSVLPTCNGKTVLPRSSASASQRLSRNRDW